MMDMLRAMVMSVPGGMIDSFCGRQTRTLMDARCNTGCPRFVVGNGGGRGAGSGGGVGGGVGGETVGLNSIISVITSISCSEFGRRPTLSLVMATRA